MKRPALLLQALGALCMAAWAAPVAAQTLTTGAISGQVSSESGAALPRVSITATSTETGLQRSTTTNRAGSFTLPYLDPGEYTVVVEQVGYRPKRITGVPVQAGSRTGLAIRVSEASGPVASADVEAYGAGAPAGSPSGAGRWLSRQLIESVPPEARTLDHLLDLTTVGDARTGIDGLPIGFSTLAMDGVVFRRALHPDLAGEGLALTPFPLLQLAGASVDPNPIEVEASELGGSWIGLSGVSGGNDFHARAFARVSPAALATSGDFTTSDAGAGLSYAIGGLLSGAVVRDSARVVVGLEARRTETPFLRAWSAPPSVAESGPFAVPRTLTQQAITGFAGFEWQISESNHVSLRGDFASYPEYDLPMLDVNHVTMRPRISGRDASASASVRTLFADSWVNELRAGFGTSRREYRSDASGPLTRLADTGAGFGSSPTLPGDFQVNRLDVTDAVTFTTAGHAFKVGASVNVASYDQSYLYDAAGEYRFGSASLLATGMGAYYQATGGAPTASFSVPVVGAFAEDRWSAVPGLEVVAGMRLDVEKLPQSDVVFDPLWAGLTGVFNTDVPSSLTKVSPRIGFRWDLEQEHQWVVSGGVGLYGERTDPAVIAAILRDHGTIDVRRGVGNLGSWPASPDETAAPVVGSSLSLIGPDFQAPLTLHASLGIDRALGAAAALHLAAGFRKTDNLPRVDDLNLLRQPSAADQYGRPIFGELVKQGELLSARLGSNRRFEQYDAVTTYTSDGTSRSTEFSAGLDARPTDGLRLFARYTYSKTTDDWLGEGRTSVEYGLDPLAVVTSTVGDGVSPVSGADWADGRSDLDVPSRLALGGVASGAAGGVRLELSGVYVRRSGVPFTPGFRPGVDANADGSGLNDPAYVDANVSGMPGLLSSWDCLRKQVGRTAERNACRGDARSSLDLRLSAGLPQLTGTRVRAFVDAVNVVRTGDDLPDAALYRVDPNRDLSTSAGTVNIPLLANPNFGEPLIRNVYPRVFRFGLEVSY